MSPLLPPETASLSSLESLTIAGMTVSLSPDVEAFLRDKVRVGAFTTIDEAADQLLAQLQSQQKKDAAELDALRKEIDIGIADLDEGRVEDFTAESVIAERRAARRRGA